MIAAELAYRLGYDLEITGPEDVWEEISSRSAVHGRFDYARLDDEPGSYLITATGRIPFIPVEERIETRPVDSYAMRLILGRRMFDRGTITQMSSSYLI